MLFCVKLSICCEVNCANCYMLFLVFEDGEVLYGLVIAGYIYW